MNVNLKDVIRTSKDGDQFWSIPEMYIRGNTIKYLRVPDVVLDVVAEEKQAREAAVSALLPVGDVRGAGRILHVDEGTKDVLRARVSFVLLSNRATCRETEIAAGAGGGADALVVAHVGVEAGVEVGVEGVQDARGKTDDECLVAQSKPGRVPRIYDLGCCFRSWGPMRARVACTIAQDSERTVGC